MIWKTANLIFGKLNRQQYTFKTFFIVNKEFSHKKSYQTFQQIVIT